MGRIPGALKTSREGIDMSENALAIRVNPDNHNHHLWNNNGTWFIHYTVYPTPITKARVRRSLGTRDLAVARARRDELLAALRERVPWPAAA
jgi:hypothetical protein